MTAGSNTLSPKRLLSWLGRPRVRPILIGLVTALIITQIVILSPASLESGRSPETAIMEPKSLMESSGEDQVLATGIPKGVIPEYTVEQFEYVSTREGERQWKLDAERAFLYNQHKLVHARKIKAFLFDAAGKITTVTGKEAKYFMNARDLEIFGDVNVTFPDGFKLASSYMRYLPAKKKIEIPAPLAVRGEGDVEGAAGQRISFESHGLDWNMSAAGLISLPEAVTFRFENRKSKDGPTTIVSDRCIINREQQLAHFTMSPKRPLAKQFVEMRQTPEKQTQASSSATYAKSRRADLNYGDMSSKPESGKSGSESASSMLQYMTLYEDVLIRENGKPSSLQYATGGRADFDSNRNVIVLSEFPQVYQDNDTVTGDIIVLHRDTDVVEVQNSNAFSQGEKQQ